MTLDELEKYGLETMREEEIDSYLDSQSTGVLGLPGEDEPYLFPLSYAYDGESLYFTYLVGESSRKQELTERTDRAQFLVYSAESMFTWESVSLVGTLESIPPSEWDALSDTLAGAWRPELFETASTSRAIRIYAFDILESNGIKQTGLPPGMQRS